MVKNVEIAKKQQNRKKEMVKNIKMNFKPLCPSA